MQITIDLSKLNKKKLTINQYLLLLKIYYRSKEVNLEFTEIKADYLFLRDNGFLVIDGSAVILQKKAINLIEGTSGRDYELLAQQIREMFPRGAKGGKYPWRASIKDLSARLKKLDKHHELDNYSNDIVLKTVDSYVNKFTIRDMDSGMQICKYFLEKDGSSSLMDLLSMQEEQPSKEDRQLKIKL